MITEAGACVQLNILLWLVSQTCSPRALACHPLHSSTEEHSCNEKNEVMVCWSLLRFRSQLRALFYVLFYQRSKLFSLVSDCRERPENKRRGSSCQGHDEWNRDHGTFSIPEPHSFTCCILAGNGQTLHQCNPATSQPLQGQLELHVSTVHVL